LSRQLRQIAQAGLSEVVMTTGRFHTVLMDYCRGLGLPLRFTFVYNEQYEHTNYIYSIYLARQELDDDILLLHGDLVLENEALDRVLASEESCMAVSTTAPLPEKDFKAVVEGGCITKVGIHFFDHAVAAQPLYYLKRDDWKVWLDQIAVLCERGETNCYAENALNEVSSACAIAPMDVWGMLCSEVDSPEDLAVVSARLRQVESRTVYMCFSSDVLHSGHMEIIKKAARLGRLTVGVLSDQAVASYKRYPLLPFQERVALFSSLKGVERVVEQKQLSYRDTLLQLRPDIVVHGDDWREGFQKPLRQEVLDVLATYGGRLVEFPYASDPKYRELDERSRAELSLPDSRRGRLKKLLELKGLVTAMEAHDGISGLVVEHTVVHDQGRTQQFDAMWVSSLCDSTAKGKPDIELVDMTSRFRTIDDLTEVTTKPIIFDGDTGGLTEHFVYTVKSLEKMGVSAVIIEDKTGLKKNSLFGAEVRQTQDTIENFCAKITAGKHAQKSADFMIIARVESLILEQGMDDALTRAFAYVQAGADGIMIHSRRTEPDEIFTFVERFRQKDAHTPLVVVPTSFHAVTEEEFKARGVNIVIYANQLMRSEVPAMRRTAESILKNHRALEADQELMSFNEIIRLIPEER
jgi:phosphoenolpyruvate phosphomutase